LYLSNGERFEGTFKDDFISGDGMFFTRDGGLITGRW
jgi:hypothetical protein